MKQLLKNARIYDGSGSDAFQGDVLITDETITRVAPSIDDDEAVVTDLSGLSLSSGFFDAHSHNDWFVIKKDPLAYLEPFIRQGITSFMGGNCGVSEIGFEEGTPHQEAIGAGLFGFKGTKGVYPTARSFFAAVDHQNPVNIGTLVGHCTARAGIAGLASRPLDASEQERMLSCMERDLNDGAAGCSFGLMYEPGLYAPRAELKAVADLCVAHDVPLTVHPRAESKTSMAYASLLGRAHILRALDELHDIARGTRLKLQYSHFITVGRKTFKYKDEALAILKEMKEEGIDVMFDIYDECLGVSVITVVMPIWYQALSPEKKRSFWNKTKFSLLCKASILLLGFDFNDITVAYVGEGHEKYEGKTVSEIARESGKSDVDAYLDLCEMSDFKGRVNMGPYSTPEIIADLAKQDMALFMTDAWIEDHGIQNPAVYDNHPKFLHEALLGKLDTMPRMIRKMTGAVADRFAIADRGYVRSGCAADLTVFAEDELKAATPDQGKPFGIKRVFINGHQVLADGVLDRDALKTSGEALRARH